MKYTCDGSCFERDIIVYLMYMCTREGVIGSDYENDSKNHKSHKNLKWSLVGIVCGIQMILYSLHDYRCGLKLYSFDKRKQPFLTKVGISNGMK